LAFECLDSRVDFRSFIFEMSLPHTKLKAIIQGSTTEELIVDRGLKQGDVISIILFNIVLEYVISRLLITPKHTIFNRIKQCIAYADDIVILGRGVNYLKEVIEELTQGATKVGLEINQGKTKYMIITKEYRQMAGCAGVQKWRHQL
jgi:hypothetical protein